MRWCALKPGALQRSSSGFSLLEILVVITIIAIMVGAAAIGFGGRQDSLRDEARRLYNQMRVLREEAVLQNRQFGLEIIQDEEEHYRYRWLEYDSVRDSWRYSRRVGDGAPRKLPANIRMELDIQEELIDLENRDRDRDEDSEDDDKESQGWPQIFFLSSGEVSPFRLYLRQDSEDISHEILLEGDMIGRIKVHWEEE